MNKKHFSQWKTSFHRKKWLEGNDSYKHALYRYHFQVSAIQMEATAIDALQKVGLLLRIFAFTTYSLGKALFRHLEPQILCRKESVKGLVSGLWIICNFNFMTKINFFHVAVQFLREATACHLRHAIPVRADILWILEWVFNNATNIVVTSAHCLLPRRSKAIVCFLSLMKTHAFTITYINYELNK